MTLTQAKTDKVCISCYKPVVVDEEGTPNPELFYSVAGVNEWNVSGMCEKCFDEAFKDG